MRVVALLLAMLIVPPSVVYSQDDIFQTLSCTYENILLDYKSRLDADMRTESEFLNEAFFISDDAVFIYSVAQERAQGSERFRFVLNESDPQDTMRVQVYGSGNENLRSVVTFLSLSGPLNQVEGTCLLWK